jgi:hypothetical protein
LARLGKFLSNQGIPSHPIARKMRRLFLVPQPTTRNSKKKVLKPTTKKVAKGGTEKLKKKGAAAATRKTAAMRGGPKGATKKTKLVTAMRRLCSMRNLTAKQKKAASLKKKSASMQSAKAMTKKQKPGRAGREKKGPKTTKKKRTAAPDRPARKSAMKASTAVRRSSVVMRRPASRRKTASCSDVGTTFERSRYFDDTCERLEERYTNEKTEEGDNEPDTPKQEDTTCYRERTRSHSSSARARTVSQEILTRGECAEVQRLRSELEHGLISVPQFRVLMNTTLARAVCEDEQAAIARGEGDQGAAGEA